MSPDQFNRAILHWFSAHGRTHLPWQQQPTPYRVWVSEIMLQQTQVSTVIDYFTRFMARFPTLEQLAQAPLDEVLHLWTGLGYYSRARNLHKTAQRLVDAHHGQFPASVAELEQLPGIGRSTAGAIASLSMGLRAPILDGNVRRVLARYMALAEHPGTSQATRQLWQLAEELTPYHANADYTQAMMDMGATLCTRRQPECERCPVQTGCLAFQRGLQHKLPVPRPKKTLPQQHSIMLLLENQQQDILLYQREPQGLWGGLYCLPEVAELDALDSLLEPHALTLLERHALPVLKHTFSHFQLHIQPWHLKVTSAAPQMTSTPWVWYNRRDPQPIGLAAPIKTLLNSLPKAF